MNQVSISGKVPAEVKRDLEKLSKRLMFRNKSHLVGWIVASVVGNPLELATELCREKQRELQQALDVKDKLQELHNEGIEESTITIKSLLS